MQHPLPLPQNPDFQKLWTAQTISALGSRISREGLPLTAILLLGASPAALGAMGALAALPGVLLSPLLGVWVDRTSRRGVLVGADLGRALALLSVPLAAWAGVLGMGQLIAVAALVSALSLLFDLADRAWLPSLVGQARLQEANARLSATDAAAETAGPALAGALVTWLTAPVTLILDALSYLGSAALIVGIRGPAVEARAPAEEPLRQAARAGFDAIRAHPLLRPLWVSGCISSFFGSFFIPLYVLYVVHDLGLSPLWLGITVAMGGVGGLLGAALASRVAPGPRLLGARTLGTAFQALIPLAHGPAPWALALLIVAQLVGDGLLTAWHVGETTLRQQAVDEALLGRVNAAFHLALGLLGAAGAALAGLLAEAWGVRPVLWVAVAGLLLANGVLWAAPALRRPT